MSFTQIKESIDYGDTVLLHIGYNNMHPIIVKEGKTHQTKYGAVHHDDLVGKKFGTRFQCPKGYIYPLHPTPELWTQSLPHRTQILYTADISMVIFQLDLKPGCKVIEAGTGSGSLSHSILRTIQPSGHLYTFEFHKERAKKAEEEFCEHGLASFVTVINRDVCEDGFLYDDIADAVFLDLPRPWDCIVNAKKALKKEGGRICTFSPCIEQVQRSCEKLREEGFQSIETLECLNRKFNIQYVKMQNLSFHNEQEESLTQETISDAESPKESTSSETYESPAKVLKLSETQKYKESDAINEKTKVKKSRQQDSTSLCFPSAVPVTTMPGHTGFLTFASLPCQLEY